MFNEARIDINYLQKSTALLAYHNHEKETAQIWVVPAGQGKSKIHAAMTFLFLTKTDYDIYVVFHDDGLLKKDMEQNKNLAQLCEAAGLKYS